MTRRILSLASLALAILVLVLRVREINRPAPPVTLAPRTLHVLYLDSLRQELLAFAEQYGRPVFQYDTTSPVTGHGRIQLARLRNALFDPKVEYIFGDEGFIIDWRGDPKPRARSFISVGGPPPPAFVPIGQAAPFGSRYSHGIANAWPGPAAEYARLRRIFVTPRWPEPPVPRANRHVPTGVPPHADASSILALDQLF
jgi:hypothetical protein